jgi:exopolyphosphatase/guanosine-5'-triphosphate,3'-diphosphate pyrophosphatase
MAEHIDADGNIDRALIDSLVEFVEEGQEFAEDRGATEIIAFATSAIREAGNGDAVIAEINERTGL